MKTVSFWKDMMFACLLFGVYLILHQIQFPTAHSADNVVTIPLELPEPERSAPSFTAKELQCLRNVIYGEARGEPRMTQIAVAATVINRALHESWPDDLCHVVKQKNQFHGYKAVIQLNNELDVQSWDEALEIANYTAGHYYELPLGMHTALFFKTKGARKGWSGKYQQVASLGGINFYG